MRSIHRVGLVLALGLEGCDSRPPDGQRASTRQATIATPDSVAPPPKLQDTLLPRAKARSAINLAGEGLRVVDLETGRSRAIDFGTQDSLVLAALATMFGPARERAVNPECGAGTLNFSSWSNGLTVWLQDARFIGWGINRPAQGAMPEGMRELTTAAGIGIGSTRKEMDEAYVLKVSRTTLGIEFDAGGVYGVLTSASPRGEVTSLWAGTTCIFR